MGSASEVGFKLHTSEFFQREYEKFKNKGPAFGVYFFTEPILIPTDPDLIKEILVASFDNFHDHGFYVNEKADPLSKNIFFTAGQEWKELRAKLSPTFTSGKMKMMFPAVASHADQMIEYLKPFADKCSNLELKEIYASFTTEVISDVAFGLETKCLGNVDNEFRKMGKAVFEPTALEGLKFFFITAYPKLGHFFNMSFNRQSTTDFFMGTVRQTLNYREKNNVQRNDFFQLLMNYKNTGNALSFNEMAANSFIFFAAG
jgi:cytochrome P450 family 6